MLGAKVEFSGARWIESHLPTIHSVEAIAMILSGPFLVHAVRWVPPAVCLLGTTATYMNAMALLQCAALLLPARVASRLEVGLYSCYQRMVGFWYETWSGVEVGGARAVMSVIQILYLFSSVLFLW